MPTDEKVKVRRPAGSIDGAPDLGGQSKDMARAPAEMIHSRWVEVREAYSHVVDYAVKHEEFRAFLISQEGIVIGSIEKAVGFVAGIQGEAGVLARVKDGSLGRDVARLSTAP